jgi:2'-5' RNA ligase
MMNSDNVLAGPDAAVPEELPVELPPAPLPPSLVPIPPPVRDQGSAWTPQAPAASALPFPAPCEPTPQWPRTFGVAIPIPEPFLAELGAYRERFGDPLAHAIVAHITLVPPTQVADAPSLAAVIEHLAQVAAEFQPFRLVLAGVPSFRPISPVVFVPLDSGEADVRRIEAAVRAGPLDRVLKFPFHPHVTVAHDVAPEWLDEAEATMADYRAEFEVTALALFENGPDGVWRETRQFELG